MERVKERQRLKNWGWERWVEVECREATILGNLKKIWFVQSLLEHVFILQEKKMLQKKKLTL